MASLLAIVACGGGSGGGVFSGGGALSLDEYFQQVAEHQDALDGALQDVPPDDPATVADARDQVALVLDAYGALYEGLSDLEPPEEAAAAHAETVDGVRDLLDVLEEGQASLDDVNSGEEALDLLNGLDTSGLDATIDGCIALQDVADANAVDVDLGCFG